MKRTYKILIATLFIGIAGIGTWYWLTRPPRHYRAEELLPATTWAYLDIPDLSRSRDRFSQTALGKILAEPEVRTFFQRPCRSVLPSIKAAPIIQSILNILAACQGEVFLACTDVSVSPRLDVDILVGLDPRDQRKRAEALLEDLIVRCRIHYPESKVEEREFDGVPYRVWIPFKKFEIAVATLGNFLLFSHGEASLQKAILCAQGQVENRLADFPPFQEQLAKYPDRDVVTFVNLAAAVDPLKPLLSLRPELRDQMDWILPFRSFCGVSSFRDGGTESHSWIGLTGPSSAPWSGLQECNRLTLRAAGPDAVFYGATTLNLSDWLGGWMSSVTQPDRKEEGGFMDFILRTFKVPFFQGEGNFLADLGPEVALVVDWKESQPVPSPSLIMQAGSTRGMELVIRQLSRQIPQLIQGVLRDPAKTVGKPLSNAPAGDSPGNPTVKPSAVPCFAVSGTTVILSVSREAIAERVDTLEGRRPRLADDPEFQRVSSRVRSGGVLFTYCDQRRLFERVYRLVRRIEPPRSDTPVGRATARVYGYAKDYLDLGKLPSREKIAPHLFPSVTTQWATTNGYFKSSFGPVSFPSLVFGIADLAGSENRRAD